MRLDRVSKITRSVSQVSGVVKLRQSTSLVTTAVFKGSPVTTLFAGVSKLDIEES